MTKFVDQAVSSNRPTSTEYYLKWKVTIYIKGLIRFGIISNNVTVMDNDINMNRNWFNSEEYFNNEIATI